MKARLPNQKDLYGKNAGLASHSVSQLEHFLTGFNVVDQVASTGPLRGINDINWTEHKGLEPCTKMLQNLLKVYIMALPFK